MPYLVKMQAEQNKNQFTSSTHTIGKGLGVSLLCLSLLAGCASKPDQEQAIDSAENTIQPENVTPSESESSIEQVSTETQTSPQTAEANPTSTENASQEATTESALTTPEAAPKTTSAAVPVTTNAATAAEPSAVTEENLAPAEASTTTELNGEPTADTTTAAEALATSDGAAVVAQDAATSEEPVSQPLTRSSKNLGKSYGIWTLKDAGNGFCKLKTPTLQIGNKDYSSQIWMDIEEQQIIVNAYMALDIKHPKTGIQIDNQALIPFTEKVNSTRAIVSGDMTTQLSAAKELHIFINGKEVGKQVLERNVKLTNMNAAISALRTCSN